MPTWGEQGESLYLYCKGFVTFSGSFAIDSVELGFHISFIWAQFHCTHFILLKILGCCPASSPLLSPSFPLKAESLHLVFNIHQFKLIESRGKFFPH